MPIDLRKVEAVAPSLLPSATTAKAEIERSSLNGQLSNVALCLDFSASMRKLYNNGTVQSFSEQILALATQLDENGEIDVFAFDWAADHLGSVSIEDYEGSIDRLTRGRRMGSTNYAAAFDTVDDFYKPKKSLFARKEKAATHPTLVLFVTDGVPDSKTEAVKSLTRVSSRPIFWQFLSIGAEIPFLTKLDDLKDRFVDNADYENVADVGALSDVELFRIILKEYPGWVTEMTSRGRIA